MVNYSFQTTMHEKDIRIHTAITSHGAGTVTNYEQFKLNCK